MRNSTKWIAVCISVMMLIPLVGCSETAQSEVVIETEEQLEPQIDEERTGQRKEPGEFDGEHDIDSIRQDIEQKVANGELTPEEADELLEKFEEGGGPERNNRVKSEGQTKNQ